MFDRRCRFEAAQARRCPSFEIARISKPVPYDA
jgi:hypothetical protein